MNAGGRHQRTDPIHFTLFVHFSLFFFSPHFINISKKDILNTHFPHALMHIVGADCSKCFPTLWNPGRSASLWLTPGRRWPQIPTEPNTALNAELETQQSLIWLSH